MTRSAPTPAGTRLRLELLAVAGIVLGLAVLTVFAFTIEEAPEQKTRVVIGLDVSLSSAEQTRCADLQRLGVKLLDESPGSEIEATVLATGDEKTDGEPVRLGLVAYSSSGRILEGAAQDARAHQRFQEGLAQLCAQAGSRKKSPIFQMVRAALRSLEAQRCGEGALRCLVLVRTDGIEEQEQRIVRALARARSDRDDRTRKPRLDNRGVDVVFCGLSERDATRTRRGRRLPDVERIGQVFRAEFSEPDRVRFDTSCAPFVQDHGISQRPDGEASRPTRKH